MKHIVTQMLLLVGAGFLKTSLSTVCFSLLISSEKMLLLFLRNNSIFLTLCLATNHYSKLYFTVY